MVVGKWFSINGTRLLGCLRATCISTRQSVTQCRQFSAAAKGSDKRRHHRWRYLLGACAMTAGAVAYVKHEIFNTDKQAKKWQVTIYTVLPLKILSRLWGKINGATLPESMREPVLKWYIRTFEVNMDEAAVKDLKHYRNLGEFFRRRLTPSCRRVDSHSCLVSPSDGKVLHFGCLEEGQLEQVKGVTYSLSQFLGPNNWPSRRNGYKHGLTADDSQGMPASYDVRVGGESGKALYYCTIYLAPGDYHGFHSPADWLVSFRRHFPGELLSVNPGVARWVGGLFNLNERAVYVGEWRHGFFAMAPVGATNVGSIRVYHDQNLLTNVKRRRSRGRGSRDAYSDEVFARADIDGISLKKGESFGEFNLGSSIVLIFEAPDSFCFTVKPGDKIRYGQSLGCFRTDNIESNDQVS